MSILLRRTYVVPTGFIVIGLLALLAPIPAAGVLLLCVVGATAVMIIFALRIGPNDRDARHLATVAPTAPDSGRKR